mmetsp:Transcript_31964/g.100350  ORF Transcript_31964/g.100350 Transcript_31964/m.100350 type:complete len:153 (+) Transcript_31964:645-1103(+)
MRKGVRDYSTTPRRARILSCPIRLYAWQSPIHCTRAALGIQRIHPLHHHMHHANRQALSTLGAGLLSVKTPLQIAASKGHADVVAALLEAGADPNAPPSDTPLDAAVEKGHEGTAAVLMEAGGVHSTPVSRGLSMLHTLMAGLLLGSLIPWM